MNSVVEYRRRDDVTQSPVGSGSGGGGVDDFLRRLCNVENDVRAISATLPSLATAVSVSNLRAEVTAIAAGIPHLATKADLKAEVGSVRTEIADVRTAVAEVRIELASMETKIIKWFIATGITVGGLAFTIAKFVH